MKERQESLFLFWSEVVKVANLRFFSAPSWQVKDDVGTLHTSEGYIIDAKVRVNGLPQHNIRCITVKGTYTI